MSIRCDRLFWLILVIVLLTQLRTLGPSVSRMVGAVAEGVERTGTMLTDSPPDGTPEGAYRLAVLCVLLIAFVGVVKLWCSAAVRSRPLQRRDKQDGDDYDR